MSKLINQEIDSLLKETSRSFYLTLKALPRRIRSQVGLLYLLARIADTIADSESESTDQMLQALEQYNERIQGRSSTLPDLADLAKIQSNPAEKKLLENFGTPVASLEQFSSVDQERIRECLDIIISGQTLDLQRFGQSTGEGICPLATEEELDDYTYRVAGSVGEFWTHMTLGHMFKTDTVTEARLFNTGVRFGKALQLINILRDIPEDLRLGRCYVPITSLTKYDLKPSDLLDKENMEQFRPLFDSYIDKAAAHLDAAVEYIGILPTSQFRLRAACMLPVLIGQRTLTLLRTQNVLDAENRVKVLRPEIKQLKNKTLFAMFSRRRSLKLLTTNRDA
ncbi:MAG: phytoene/squalene synthase family protein [Candidatus Thalassarchaeaceae archaeon]|nr:phytoene/squalene synthase family protein [Candidatus Thalassarchaeaceae archaeon]